MRGSADRGGALLIAGITLAASCAQIEPPPGGPEDNDPPAIITTSPENEAVTPRFDGPAVFEFDERISEREVETSVIVSPRTSPVAVRPGRSQIRVSLRAGWEPDMIYHVTLMPGIRDLFGNAIAEARTIVFSTGPEIPDTRSSGELIDRITDRPEAGARVEAIRLADSLVYATASDTAGRFLLDRIPEGDYWIRAFPDENRNRALDNFEARDSVETPIRVGEPIEVSLSLLLPDSTPPEATSAALRQGVVDVQFDDYLEPEQELDPSQVTVVGPSGTPLEVSRLTVGSPPEPPAAAADTAVAAPDSAGASADGQLPSRTLRVELAEEAEVEPEEEHTITVRGIRNVNGLAGDTEATFTAPPVAPSALRPRFRADPRRQHQVSKDGVLAVSDRRTHGADPRFGEWSNPLD